MPEEDGERHQSGEEPVKHRPGPGIRGASSAICVIERRDRNRVRGIRGGNILIFKKKTGIRVWIA